MPANMMVQANNVEIQVEESTPPANSPAPLKMNGARPTSEVFSALKTPNLESEELNKWFEDLAQYERMLEEMSRANLDSSFKEELGSVENWFSALSEAERTASLFSLLHQCTNVQIRFFITVLQKLTNDPMRDLVSPGLPKPGLQSIGDYAPAQTELEGPVGGKAARRKSGHSKSVSISGDISIMGNKPLINRGISNRPVGLDVKKASEWGNGAVLSIKSASFVKDSTWGKSPTKVKNPNNLKLKVENKPETTNHTYPKTPKTPKTPKSALKNTSVPSPAFPPGLSPISWAATPHSANFSPSQYSNGYSSQNTPNKNSFKEPKPADPPVDFNVLENIPVWMRSLRLHKYTALFESMYWKDIVVLDDQALEAKGVAALGARRKFLKVFAQVITEAKEKGIDIPNAKVSDEQPSAESKPESTNNEATQKEAEPANAKEEAPEKEVKDSQ